MHACPVLCVIMYNQALHYYDSGCSKAGKAGSFGRHKENLFPNSAFLGEVLLKLTVVLMPCIPVLMQEKDVLSIF